jgi:hypothetical protein
MSVLFDYGEAILCFFPVFILIAFIFFALLWDSLPLGSKKDKE